MTEVDSRCKGFVQIAASPHGSRIVAPLVAAEAARASAVLGLTLGELLGEADPPQRPTPAGLLAWAVLDIDEKAFVSDLP